MACGASTFRPTSSSNVASNKPISLPAQEEQAFPVVSRRRRIGAWWTKALSCKAERTLFGVYSGADANVAVRPLVAITHVMACVCSAYGWHIDAAHECFQNAGNVTLYILEMF